MKKHHFCSYKCWLKHCVLSLCLFPASLDYEGSTMDSLKEKGLASSFTLVVC